MYTIINDKEKSFIVTYEVKKITQDKYKVKNYRLTIEAGKFKKEDFLYLNNLFSDMSNDMLKKICENLNNKTKIYEDKLVSISILVTANHTFKFKIEDIFSKTDKKTKRVAISLSNEEYNQLINIHAITNNKTISHTLKKIYLQGLTQKDICSIEDYKNIKLNKKSHSLKSQGIIPLPDKGSISYKDLSGLSIKELNSIMSESVRKQKASLKITSKKLFIEKSKDNIVPLVELNQSVNDDEELKNTTAYIE